MPPRTITRREALQIGAGAAALAALPARPAAAASCGVPVFEQGLDTGGARAAAAGWTTLPPARAPRRFDLIGLRWRHARRPEVQVRARKRGGAWTRWTSLHASGDHGPDGARALQGTDPAWTGPADLFQVRLRGDIRGLRARFVRAAPAARSGTLARTSARRATAASPEGIRIIPREEWGGDRCEPRTTPEYGQVQVAFVHHTVSANDYGPEDSAAIVLGICRYHRDSNGWNDLGYNFLVDRYGQVFEGRAGGVDRAVVGAQAQGYNSVSTGVACIGDFSTVAQSEAGLDALARLLGWKLSVHGAPVEGKVTVTSAGGSTNRYPSGTRVTLDRISGHRDGNRTACPGDALHGQLAALRRRAAGYAQPLSSLVNSVEPPEAAHGEPVTLSGRLRFADGSSTAGVRLELQHQRSQSARPFHTVATTEVAADGTWSAEVVPPASGLLRARFPGDGTRGPLEARPVEVAVRPAVTLEVSPRQAVRGDRVEVSGTVGPQWPSRVRLKFHRRRPKRAKRRWKRIQSKRINVRGGSFESYVRPPRTGRYRVTIKGPGIKARRRFRAREFTGGASAG